MGRQLRILTYGATFMSLLFCAASIALWVRSHRVIESITWVRAADSQLICSCDSMFGCFTIFSVTQSRAAGGEELRYNSWPAELDFASSHRLQLEGNTWHGFAWHTMDFHNSDGSVARTHYFQSVPYWFVVLCTAVLPTILLCKRRRTRERPGRCSVCNYDLRATPERCPECGTLQNTKAVRLSGSGG